MTWFAWALLAALFAALTALFSKIGVRELDASLATAIRTSVVLVFAWSLALATGPVTALRGLTGKTWLFLCLSGVATGLSWWCYLRALQTGEASKVASVDKLGVVFVLVLAALFLGEKLTFRTAFGGGFIVLGSLLIAGR